MIKKIHACNKINFSSNVIEVIRPILNFFYKKILHTPKAQKSTKSTKSTKKHKNLEAPKSTKNTKSIKLQPSKSTKRK